MRITAVRTLVHGIKSFMIASTEGEMDMFRRSPKFLLHLTKEEYDLIVYSMINMKNELTRQGKYGSVKNVGVVVTLIYFRALFFLKNDWF